MAKPDPQEFAKSVSLRLASIQAAVYPNQLLLVEILATQTNRKATDIQKQWKIDSEKLRMTHHLAALDAAGINRHSGRTSDNSFARS